MTEQRETKIRRLHMRSIRRGIKEMDLILSDYAQRHLPNLSDDGLALYDDLLAENDHDIYGWITGHIASPDRYADVLDVMRTDAHGLTRPE
jgi:antitoxin CptB